MNDQPRPVTVTPRQRDVLAQLIWDGADDKTIAARLQISPQTVTTHLRGIYRAFACFNRTQVVVDVLRGRVDVTVVDSRGAHMRKDVA